MNILLNGSQGFMGREVRRLCQEGYRGAQLAVSVDPFGEANYTGVEEISSVDSIDCIIDFSNRAATSSLLDFATKYNLPLVLATTGQTPQEIEDIKEAAKRIPLFYSGNMSLGIALLIELAKTAAAAMPDADIEIIEKHHNRKIDAPSGTALMIGDAICDLRPDAYTTVGRSGIGKRHVNEIGIHSIRMANIVGEHEVIIGTAGQTITLKHEAHTRGLFAEGAIAAADFLVKQCPGLYAMKDMISSVCKTEDAVISAE